MSIRPIKRLIKAKPTLEGPGVKVAKFWLEPIRLRPSGGFSRPEIGRIQRLVRAHHKRLLEAWYAYFRG